MGVDRTLIDAVRGDLAAAADPARAAGQQAYMKSTLPYYGVSVPGLRTLLRPHLRGYDPADRETWEATVRALWAEATHREEWYVALALARHRSARDWRDPASLPLWRDLVTAGAWWDVVDEIAGHLVGDVLLRHREAATPAIREWATDDDLWIRRTAVLAQHLHKDATDTGLLADVVDANLDDASFWLRKAIGWALRDYSKVDPGWVRDFVSHHDARISGLSRREALRRIDR